MGESIRADEIDLLTASAAQTPAAAGMTTRVARGTLWTLVGHGAVMVASLVATPFTIRMLGPESYGVLALVNVLVGYLAFTDVGMGLTATRFRNGRARSVGRRCRGPGRVDFDGDSARAGFFGCSCVSAIRAPLVNDA